MNGKKIIRICAAICGLSGLVILVSTMFPIVAYELEAKQKYPILLSPVVEEKKENGAAQIEDNSDYTRAGNWFAEDSERNFTTQNISFFTITIPRLKITDATVAIGGEDLSEHLIQYPGTALPGKLGNGVIFGHSVLPMFFNPKNYMTIFSTLDRLKDGDKILVNFDGITYEYRVEDMFEVRPTDIQILDQDKSDSFLTLVTCSPMGDPRKPKRLIVKARLTNNLQANANIGY
jgi:sortase A